MLFTQNTTIPCSLLRQKRQKKNITIFGIVKCVHECFFRCEFFNELLMSISCENTLQICVCMLCEWFHMVSIELSAVIFKRFAMDLKKKHTQIMCKYNTYIQTSNIVFILFFYHVLQLHVHFYFKKQVFIFGLHAIPILLSDKTSFF